MKKLLIGLLFLAVSVGAKAQSESPLAYLNKTFPKLTELFKEELNEYNAHYIFAVDVSGSMHKYEKTVADALTPFFKALPNADRVHVIPFGSEAKISELGLSGQIDDGVKRSLCDNIKTLYTTYYKQKGEFIKYTDIPNAIDGVSRVMQNNRDYKVNIVIVITDFKNDQKGLGECKIKEEYLQKMHSAIKAATGDAYTRFIALQLPVDTNAKGYCVNQLSEKVFSFDDHTLEVVQVQQDQNMIKQWFEQLKREIMVTKLRAIVHDANKAAPVNMEIEKDIDGNVVAKINWTPSKLYPKIKIDNTTCSGDSFVFENKSENFVETDSPEINVELGQIRHQSYGFHDFEDVLNLGLTLPTDYDNELEMLEAVKPIPETSVTSPGWVFTFFLSFKTTVIILILIILYIIGVINAIIRNGKLCFKATVTFYDHLGNQIDDVVRIQKQAPSAVMTFGRGGSPRCKVDDAEWQFVVQKKKGNPFLLFVKPHFEWVQRAGYVAMGKSRSGKLTDSVRLKCGVSASEQTHSVRIKLTN